jgi:hypothetical protein
MISILVGDILLDLGKEHKIITKLFISDQKFNLSYSLSDLSLIQKIPTITEPEYELDVQLSNEDISSLIKAKTASASTEVSIRLYKDFDGSQRLEFIFGDRTEHSNKVSYYLPKFNSVLEQLPNFDIPYNSDLLKEILSVNRDNISNTLYLSLEGLLKLTFSSNQITNQYFLIREESNN